MKRVNLIIGVVLLVGFLAVLAVAKPGGGEGRRGVGGEGGPGPGPGGGMILRMQEELGLDPNQVEQLKAIHIEGQEKVKAAGEAIRTQREAMRAAVESGADEAAIRAIASEMGKAIGDQAILQSGMKAKVAGVLTDDQKAKLEELKNERKEGRKERFDGDERGNRDGKKGHKEGRESGRKERGENGKGPESAFGRIDSDGDGSISLEEFTSHMEQMRERGGDRGPRDRR